MFHKKIYRVKRLGIRYEIWETRLDHHDIMWRPSRDPNFMTFSFSSEKEALEQTKKLEEHNKLLTE